MPTLLDIKAQVATLFQRDVADLTINGRDAFLDAVNQARRTAELSHDFEFNRQIVTLTVDGVTGGALSSAVLAGTATLAVIKTVVDIGTLDENDNFLPQFWSSVGSSLERQRQDNPATMFRYPTDGQVQASPAGSPRFVLRNDKVFRWPADTEANNDYDVAIEAYVYTREWTAADIVGSTSTATVSGALNPTGTYSVIGALNSAAAYLRADEEYFIFFNGTNWIILDTITQPFLAPTDYWLGPTTPVSAAGTYAAQGGAAGTATVALSIPTVTDTWTNYGYDYLLWQTIVILNHYFKEFVPRTEGNLPPPKDLAEAGLLALIEWDEGKFSRYQRSSR